MQMTKTGVKAPYTKYKKAPYQYSPAYQRWRDAVHQSGGKVSPNTVKALSKEHQKQFGPNYGVPVKRRAGQLDDTIMRGIDNFYDC